MKAVAVHLDQPCPYALGLDVQQQLHQARLEDKIPDTVLFLEHTPVVTLGRRGRTEFLLTSADALAARGIDFFIASRGGDVTYHGPGQLVMYPILKFSTCEADAHGYLANLERIAIETAEVFGVQAYRREGMSGAWTDAGKIAAIGFYIKRWVTMHGLSFNVGPDLEGFSTIIGCGLKGESVASLNHAPGAENVTMSQVREAMGRIFATVMQRSIDIEAADRIADPDDIKRLLARLTKR